MNPPLLPRSATSSDSLLSSVRRAAALAALSATLTVSLEAQSSSAADDLLPKSDDEIVEMSPFVVTSESTHGYAATNTLAGTRLNTPLKDIGTAISVVTKEFMEDIGASGAQSLLTYTTGHGSRRVERKFRGQSGRGWPAGLERSARKSE